MASEIPMITVYVQNMSGEIHTLSCPFYISIDDFYHLVRQSLPEPRPSLQNIRLLQKKIRPSLSEDSKEAQEEDDDEFVSLVHILDKHTIYLFIEDVKIDVRFLYQWPSVVENNDYTFKYNPDSPVIYVDGTRFEKYTLQVFLDDEKIMDYDFHTLVIEEYGPSPDFHYYKKYTNIYHNDDDIKNVGGISEYYNGGGDEMTIRFKEYSCPYSSPVFLVSSYLLGVHSHLEDTISEMVNEKWMEHVIKTGDDVLHPYPLK
jgi:hypothetical protein